MVGLRRISLTPMILLSLVLSYACNQRQGSSAEDNEFSPAMSVARTDGSDQVSQLLARDDSVLLQVDDGDLNYLSEDEYEWLEVNEGLHPEEFHALTQRANESNLDTDASEQYFFIATEQPEEALRLSVRAASSTLDATGKILPTPAKIPAKKLKQYDNMVRPVKQVPGGKVKLGDARSRRKSDLGVSRKTAEVPGLAKWLARKQPGKKLVVAKPIRRPMRGRSRPSVPATKSHFVVTKKSLDLPPNSAAIKNKAINDGLAPTKSLENARIKSFEDVGLGAPVKNAAPDLSVSAAKTGALQEGVKGKLLEGTEWDADVLKAVNSEFPPNMSKRTAEEVNKLKNNFDTVRVSDYSDGIPDMTKAEVQDIFKGLTPPVSANELKWLQQRNLALNSDEAIEAAAKAGRFKTSQ